jgi:hypothetical protein
VTLELENQLSGQKLPWRGQPKGLLAPVEEYAVHGEGVVVVKRRAVARAYLAESAGERVEGDGHRLAQKLLLEGETEAPEVRRSRAASRVPQCICGVELAVDILDYETDLEIVQDLPHFAQLHHHGRLEELPG